MGGAMSPLFVGSGRAVVAAVLAAGALALSRQALPNPRAWARLAIVAGGVVIGFPLLTSIALVTTPASHGAVVIALLPAATAAISVWRTRERPPRVFWLFASLGAVAAVAFALIHSSSLLSFQWADLLLLGAVVVCAIGYAEGGLLARELGAWQTISWALVLAAPLMIALTVVASIQQSPRGSLTEWAAFAYLGVVSMFLGFFAWYHGLALGPIAQVSQIQVVQPVLSICWAALILSEPITWVTALGGIVVICCALLAVRVRAHGRVAETAKTRHPNRIAPSLGPAGTDS